MDSAYHQRVKAMLQKIARERDMGVGAGVSMGGVNMGGVLMGAGPAGTKKGSQSGEWIFVKTDKPYKSWNHELGSYESKLRELNERYIKMPKELRAKKRAEATKKYREEVKLGMKKVKPRKPAKEKTSKKLTAWQQFVKDNRKSGVSLKELAESYRAEKGEISKMVSSALANVQEANPEEAQAAGLYGRRKRYF